jgi:hypothetical protein
MTLFRLVHGTTLFRAKSIIANGPNPSYRERGGSPTEDGFSTYIMDDEKHIVGQPELYAYGKANQGRSLAKSEPDELIPVLLIIHNVPAEVLEAANRDGFCPIAFGLIQLDHGAGIEEFLSVRDQLTYEIVRLP